MSHFHSKLQTAKTIDLIWNREITFDCKEEHVYLLRNVAHSKYIPKDNLQAFIKANIMIVTRDNNLLLDCGMYKTKKENTDSLYKEFSSIIHKGFKAPIKKKKYFTPKKKEFY